MPMSSHLSENCYIIFQNKTIPLLVCTLLHSLKKNRMMLMSSDCFGTINLVRIFILSYTVNRKLVSFFYMTCS